MLAHTQCGNFKEMLTHDKPWVRLCVAYMTLYTHTVWVTQLLSRYVTDVFLFLAQIEFPVLDSSSSGVQRHSSLCVDAVCYTSCIWNTLGSRFWNAASEVLLAGRKPSERQDGGCLVNLWRFWNCKVIVMLCHWFEKIQMLRTEDEKWQVNANSLQHNMCRF